MVAPAAVAQDANRIALVREAAIGENASRPEEELTVVAAVTVARSGTVYAAVSDGPGHIQLRAFSSHGRFLRAIGRMGAGPGEYREYVVGLALIADTLLVVHDPMNRRLGRFDTLGNWRGHIPVAGHGGGLVPLIAFRDGTLGVEGRDDARRTDDVIALQYVRYTASGRRLDSLPAQLIRAGAAELRSMAGIRYPFTDMSLFAVLPSRAVATARSTRYRVEVRPTEGPVVVLERRVRPVPLDGEERSSWERMLAEVATRSGQPAPRLPRAKPFIREVFGDADGRVWVGVYTEATEVPVRPNPGRMTGPAWWEPNVYDLWSESGRYLGRVALPLMARVLHVQGDRIWTSERDDDGFTALVRYRLAFPSSAERR